MTPGYAEFEFDLPSALLADLVNKFAEIESASLTTANVATIPNQQGVYQLFLETDGIRRLVYIGKTDAKHGLSVRLARHAKKILHRQNLESSKVYFKALRIFVFTAVDLEAQLIAHYGGNKTVPWNGSGFGSNDPGVERDTTKYKKTHFETQFPIDVDRVLDFKLPESATAHEILSTLKSSLPYLIRFQSAERGKRTPHPDLKATTVDLSRLNLMTPENVIRRVVEALPKGWHATMLPSHIILYKDDDRRFPSGRLIGRSPE